MTSLRANEVQQALVWLRVARDVALTVDGYKGDAIVARLDHARDRICSALDIKPSEAAIEEVVAAGRINVDAAIAEEDRLRGETA